MMKACKLRLGHAPFIGIAPRIGIDCVHATNWLKGKPDSQSHTLAVTRAASLAFVKRDTEQLCSQVHQSNVGSPTAPSPDQPVASTLCRPLLQELRASSRFFRGEAGFCTSTSFSLTSSSPSCSTMCPLPSSPQSWVATMAMCQDSGLP